MVLGSARADPATTHAPIPVILDTDIGGDIDDTWALAQLLRSPELDPKLVLVEHGDTRYRATVAAKLLTVSGRTDVPVGIGFGAQDTEEKNKTVLPWIKGYELQKYPGRLYEDGIAALIDIVMKSPEEMTIVAIGPVTNLAIALQREPRIASKCRFVGMHGDFDWLLRGKLEAETNVRVDPAALRAVLSAPWRDILLTPLDTCVHAEFTGANYHALWCATADPMLRAVIENYCIFAPRFSWAKIDFFATKSTSLCDCVAVYLAAAEELVEVETISFNVTDTGYTLRDPKGPFKARVAIRWKNLAAFEDQLTERLLGHPVK
jgi:inosine-uridine nucleoside N-ribohydrolase